MTSIRLTDWLPFAALMALLASVFGAVGRAYAIRYAISLRAAAGVYCCFMLLLLLVAAPGMAATRQWISATLPARKKAWVLVLIWCLPYVAYAGGTGDLRWTAAARLIAVAAPVPLIYSLLPVRDERRFEWQDMAVAVWLITAVLARQLNGIWNVPLNLDFMGRLFLLSLAAWSWIFVRGLPGLGYEFRFTGVTFRASALNFGLFAVAAIPAGLALHFIAWNPRWRGMGAFCTDYLEIFIFIALLEELFFRGFLQSLLRHTLNSKLAGQALIACLFGLFHILHAPFPNWRYVALASIAGWFYGSAFTQGGNLMAPALTHALVDTVWRTFFTKR